MQEPFSPSDFITIKNEYMSTYNILIVEDEGIVAKDIQQSLKKHGYQVVDTCSTSEQALLAAREKKPDLILMDIMLKGDVSGIETAEIIKKSLDIPVVFLTAYADKSTLSKAKVTEPYGYIIKPFKEIDLHTTIEMAIHKHSSDLAVKKERDLLYSLIENKDENEVLFLKSHARLDKVKTSEILFVEALKDYVKVCTENKDYVIHTTMKDIESKLSTPSFIRVHRSYVVRIDKISSINGNELIIEKQNTVIPIGASHRDELMSRIKTV
jgi:DNA-binding LytR/AlgR family response regulator